MQTAARYRTYFPAVKLIAPEPERTDGGKLFKRRLRDQYRRLAQAGE